MQDIHVMRVRSLGQEDPLEEEMQPNPLSFPGKPMDRGEAGRLQPLGSQILRHN